MRKTLLIAMAALAGQLFAGGFYLQLGNPEANPEAKKANAVLVIKATGCHDPATATLTATAVGMVNGKRQTIPLQVTKLSGSRRVRADPAVAEGRQVGHRAGRPQRRAVHEYAGHGRSERPGPAAREGRHEGILEGRRRVDARLSPGPL